MPLGIWGLKNNSRRITYGIGCVLGMPSLSPLSSLGDNNTVEKYQEVPLPNGVWNVGFGPPCWISDKKVVSVSLFALSEEKYIKNIEWISVKLIEFVVVVVLICFFVVVVLFSFGDSAWEMWKTHTKKIQTPWNILPMKKKIL